MVALLGPLLHPVAAHGNVSGLGGVGGERVGTREPSDSDAGHHGVERILLSHHVVWPQRGHRDAEVDDARVAVLVPVEEEVTAQHDVDHQLVPISLAEVVQLRAEVESPARPSHQERRGAADGEPGLRLPVHISGEPEGSGAHRQAEAAVARDVAPDDAEVELEQVGNRALQTDGVARHHEDPVRVARDPQGQVGGLERRRRRHERLAELDLVHLQNPHVALVDLQALEVRFFGRRRRDLLAGLVARRRAVGAVVALLRGLVDLPVAARRCRVGRLLVRGVGPPGAGVEEHAHGERQGGQERQIPDLHRRTSVLSPFSRGNWLGKLGFLEPAFRLLPHDGVLNLMETVAFATDKKDCSAYM